MSDDTLQLILSKLVAIEAAQSDLAAKQGEHSAAIAELAATQGEHGAALAGLAADQRKNLAATAAGFEGMNDRLDNLQSELGIVREEVKLSRSEISQFRKEYSGGYRALKDDVELIADRVGILEKA